MLDGEYAARLVCVNENLVIAATKLKDHNAAKFLDMGFQLYGAIHLLIWLSMCLFMGLFTDMFFFFPAHLFDRRESQSPDWAAGLFLYWPVSRCADCF